MSIIINTMNFPSVIDSGAWSVLNRKSARKPKTRRIVAGSNREIWGVVIYTSYRETEMWPPVRLTHVPDVLPHRPAFDQRGDPQAVVPVAAAEQQLPIVRDHEEAGGDLHPRGEGP